MTRRDFLRFSAATAPLGVLNGETSNERTVEIRTHVEVLDPKGTVKVWLPALLTEPTPFQRAVSHTFEAPGGKARLLLPTADAPGMVAAEFPPGIKPQITLTSRAVTRDYRVDLSHPGSVGREALSRYLRPTRLIPTDGLVKATSVRITKGAGTDREKARAIYEWIVENTFRDPKTLGCGRGDIRFMLESGNLSGKCADLNALFVGLARAAGLPARDVYGIRAAKSRLEAKSLGITSADITKAQHCRAEVWLSGFGWVPVDPADVRKVILEEPPGGRTLNDPIVARMRARLFGSWEMNWVAYNFAHDVVLPGSNESPIGFLMYPQAETAEGRLDCLNPATFRYEITVQ
ncbi:MAG: transglutaminase domain-containing protein [Acidobacteriota bacterium]|nr:transglutaminase domain-containing protein [Acidobacteriota bacterium]